MCMILLAWQVHPAYPLVVAANRDEFFARPTAPAWYWKDAPQVLAGRDLEAGGTWLGITRSGRFAALTNFRDPQAISANMRSRGHLVAQFLTGDQSPENYAALVAREQRRYNGFNLLFADGHELRYATNVDASQRVLAPGVYGLSNHLLDTPWPKVARAKSELTRALDAVPETEPLFALLRDELIAPDECLPRTGVSLEWERLLSAAFVRSSDYGTRSSTTVLCSSTGWLDFEERSFGPDARPLDTVRSRFKLAQSGSSASPGARCPPP